MNDLPQPKNPKKEVPKTQKEKFGRLEQANPLIREFCELFDLIIKY